MIEINRLAKFSTYDNAVISLVEINDDNAVEFHGQKIYWQVARKSAGDNAKFTDEVNFYTFASACEYVWSLVGYNATCEAYWRGVAQGTSLVMVTLNNKVWASNAMWSHTNRRPEYHANWEMDYSGAVFHRDMGLLYKQRIAHLVVD